MIETADIDTLVKTLQELIDKVPRPIIDSVVLIIVATLILYMFNKFLLRLVNLRVLDRVYYERLYRITQLITIIIVVTAIIYYFTGEQTLMYIIAGGFLIAAASNWEIIADAAGFYVILFTRMISRGDYIVLPDGSQGRVRDITLLYTILEAPHGVYNIPNRRIVRYGKLRLKDTALMRLNIRIWGFDDPSVIDDLVDMVKEALEDAAKNIALYQGTIKVYVEEASLDSAVIKALIPVSGPRPNITRFGDVILEMLSALKDTGYSVNISLELTEGFEQRWRTVA